MYTYREIAIKNSEDQAKVVAELVRDTLTSYMVMGTIDKRDVFLDSIYQIHKIKEVRVIRSESVNKQFGPPRSKEIPIDELEKVVLTEGVTKDILKEGIRNVEYTVVIPYKAELTKGVNCLSCHKAKPGEVLGAIKLTVDLTPTRNDALNAAALSILLAVGVMFGLYKYSMRFSEPYIRIFKQSKEVLSKALHGDFSGRVDVLTKDEAGNMADMMNKAFENLSYTFTDIEEKVRAMIGYGVLKSGDVLKDTSKIVDELLRIYMFKRVVEKDATKDQVYSRIISLLRDYMSFDKFSVYELDSKKNAIKPIHVEGVEGDTTWCNSVIFESADECRAKRTGMDVDSTEYTCICPSFSGECESINYYCIPFYTGGTIGGVVQIVYEKEMEPFIRMMIPYLKGYLNEASPVLEAKGYMDMLREQSLIDQLTGLYNRRFLEEISRKLSAQILRRNSSLGILMIDMDYFKQVNDVYGHDIGDKLLRHVANIIKSNIREADIVIRYGGEEILVLLVDVDRDSVEKVAEKIRQAVELNPLEISGGEVLRKTVSIGISVFPADSDRIWQCIKFADVALYKAKELGRNRIVRFTHDMWEHKEY